MWSILSVAVGRRSWANGGWWLVGGGRCDAMCIHIHIRAYERTHLLVGLALQGGHLAEDERLGLLRQRLLHVRLPIYIVVVLGRWWCGGGCSVCAPVSAHVQRLLAVRHRASFFKKSHEVDRRRRGMRPYLEAAEHEGPQDLVQLRDEPLLLLGVVDLWGFGGGWRGAYGDGMSDGCWCDDGPSHPPGPTTHV